MVYTAILEPQLNARFALIIEKHPSVNGILPTVYPQRTPISACGSNKLSGSLHGKTLKIELSTLLRADRQMLEACPNPRINLGTILSVVLFAASSRVKYTTNHRYDMMNRPTHPPHDRPINTIQHNNR